MNKNTFLKDKVILLVDDKPDVFDSLEELLDTSVLHKVTDYETAHQQKILRKEGAFISSK